MYIYTHTVEYYPAMTKNEIIPFAPTWMELEFIILSEVSQTNTVWYLLHVESKKKKIIKTNSYTQQRQTYRLQNQS